MAITTLPTPPSRSDPANFAERADDFLGALPTFGNEANALATDVNTKQGIASTAATTATEQAEIATTQAEIATTQAGIATTQASNALVSANNAADSFESLDERYLGAKTANPTLDNEGNALISGALYFNSVVGEMRVYSGTEWLATFLPEASYVTLNGTETLTNKTLDIENNTLTGVAGLTQTQTFTNKTIDIANNTLTGVQETLVSGTNIKTIAGQSVLGSGDLEVGGGAWEFISTITANNSASITFSGLPTSNYSAFYFLLSSVNTSNSTNAFLNFQVSVNGNFLTTTGDYGIAFIGGSASVTGSRTPNASNATINNFQTINNARFFNGSLLFIEPSSSGFKICEIRENVTNTDPSLSIGSAVIRNIGIIGGVRFQVSSGANIDNGTFRLYGIKKT